MNNKDVALDFLQLIIAGHVSQAYAKHIGPDFRHHNPFFAADADALRAGMQASEEQNPGKLFEIKHVLAEGAMVAVHSHLRMQAEDRSVATLHLFRMHGGKIAELWDMWMDVPEQAANPLGMF